MDGVSLNFLNELKVPFIKIGSGDIHNKPLLLQAAALRTPLIVSTGMSNMSEIIDVYECLKSFHLDFCLLHCVSSYPTPLEDVNLNVITTYTEIFPDINIGYSGHELGINVSVAAVALGAKIIERHLTLDKTWKGSDHVCSITPDEFGFMVKNIRLVEATGKTGIDSSEVRIALGKHEKGFQDCEIPCFEKLGKTIVAASHLRSGKLICCEDICIKVAEPKGMSALQYHAIIGRTLLRDVAADESLFESDLK